MFRLPAAATILLASTTCNSAEFATVEGVRQWGDANSFGGVHQTELDYRGQKIIVLFLSHTSGVPSSEPVIFVKGKKYWLMLARFPSLNTYLTAWIDGEFLVIGTNEEILEEPSIEVVRLNLGVLDLKNGNRLYFGMKPN